MQYFLSFQENGLAKASCKEPDPKAPLTLIIRSGSPQKICELLHTAREYVKAHDVQLEGITTAVNEIVMDQGFRNVNTTMVSSILERKV